MNQLRWIVAILGSVAFIVVLFLTSFQYVLYSDINFYEREYSKYEVLDDVKMQMEDVLYVTQEMMDYLIDKRDDLVIDTIVEGKEREFFNDREKIHMEDVKRLFMGGILIRKISFAITLIALLVLVLLKANLKRIIPRAFQIATVIVGIICGVAAFYISQNFNKVFVKFHYLFFDNDYWILDPETDLMINILPEGFFYDTVKAIGVTFGSLLGIILVLSVIISIVQWRKKDKDKLSW